MRVHVQTNNHAPRGGWFWLILAATLAPTSVSAQEASRRDGSRRESDPIDLAAHSIRVWDAGDTRWVILEGQVAVIQGLDGLRADRAVVRISRPGHPDDPRNRLEIDAEGRVTRIGQSDRPQHSWQTTMWTGKDVHLKPYEASGLLPLSGPPRDVALFERVFVQATTASASPSNPSNRGGPEVGAPGGSRQASAASPRAPAPRSDVAPLPWASPPPTSTSSVVVPLPATPPARGEAGPSPEPNDPAVVPSQFDEDISGVPAGPIADELPPPIEAPSNESEPADNALTVPDLAPLPEGPPTTLEPLPGPDNRPAPPARGARTPSGPAGVPAPVPEPELPGPIRPESQRVTRIFARDSTGYTAHPLPIVDGVQTVAFKGGINIVTEAPPPTGTIDITADNAILWRHVDPKKGGGMRGPNNEIIEDAGQPLEVYLEGNVIIRQDSREVAGTGDQKTYRAKQAYYDLRSGRLIGLEAEVDMFAPGLIAPTRMFSPRIDQYRPLERGPDGKLRFGFEQIRADHNMITGSRFPTPGYRFTSRALEITHVVSSKYNPNSGRTAGNPHSRRSPQKLTWLIDARQNVFFIGAVPVFYYPRFLGEADDLEPPIRSLIFRSNNYFGQQILTDWSGFRVFGIRKPEWIDNWNLDLDYLSLRTKSFPALGSELGWFGKDFLADLLDPYRRGRENVSSTNIPDGYFGYFDIWGLRDFGVDDLGSGPAVVTGSHEVEVKFGKKGFQRGPNSIPGLPSLGVPPFQNFRGRVNIRHMQSLLGEDADQDEDFRIQLEAGFFSDRHFLEEYYKRLWDVGLDQETLAYMIRQKYNWAWSIWTEANLQNFYTETQWLPRVDYYRLGDAIFNKWFTYFQHTGADYANTHTAAEVHNPFVFAFIPYDPISNTATAFRAGRFYTNHELDLPLNFANVLQVVPYVQGQAVGWTNQIFGHSVGRIWGAAGARANFMIWKPYPNVESQLFNVHGLNNKIIFEADYRDAYSNVKLNQIGIQDDLDDNTYEFTRRYFAMTNYVGGVLPPQYDPRHLILRRTLSPITGPTDVQASIQTLQLNFHQRLQTKRGPVGRRRIIDYMTLDATTTYFPYAQRDNFGKAFGQNMYNWQWFVGDRTSIMSYGWFEFWKITGQPLYATNVARHNNPFGLNVITSGINISRPPRGSVFLGYTVLDTGPINTSALNTSLSYWLSPKWYGTYSNMYDFGNGILLSSYFSVTRIGADYLVSIGLSVDPQRQSYMFAFQIAPRISPNIRLGSGVGTSQFDSRFAPTQ